MDSLLDEIGSLAHLAGSQLIDDRSSLFASLTNSSFAHAVDRRPSIKAVSSSRERCEAGTLMPMVCPNERTQGGIQPL
jgi:hypothetical protein